MMYTLAAAGKAVGRSRTTILRAVQTGRISAEKDASGIWRIQPAELHRVYPPILVQDESDRYPRTQEIDSNFNAQRAELEAARQRIRDLEARTDELVADRDEWRDQAKALRLVTGGARPWWRRVFG